MSTDQEIEQYVKARSKESYNYEAVEWREKNGRKLPSPRSAETAVRALTLLLFLTPLST
jgi:hypothetical protein